jgi:hypothetical protein
MGCRGWGLPFADLLLNRSKILQNNPSITSVRQLFVLRWLFVRVKPFLVLGHAKSLRAYSSMWPSDLCSL